jgi:hypothetical protein
MWRFSLLYLRCVDVDHTIKVTSKQKNSWDDVNQTHSAA